MNSESRFVDKVVNRLNQRLNKLSNGSKKQREMDLYENVLSLAQNYVSDEIGKYGIEEYGDLYYKIVRRWFRDNYGNGKLALPGDRIRLIKMTDDPNPIEPGTMGTVTSIDTVYLFSEDHLTVYWDNGRTLSLLVGTDEFEVIEPDNTSLYIQ